LSLVHLIHLLTQAHISVKNLKFITILALAFLHVSCTSYREALSYNSQGFVDKRLGRDAFKITYNGGRFTDLEQAIDFCLLRCSEITLERGYKYFRVTKSESGIYRYLVKNPDFYGTINGSPVVIKGALSHDISQFVAENIIVCKKTPPEDSNDFYSAENTLYAIREKYNMSK
jgi:hypothetical protein